MRQRTEILNYWTERNGSSMCAQKLILLTHSRIKLIVKNTYVGRDHNYFGVKPNGQVDFDDFGWDRVVSDWTKWISEK